MNPKDLPADLVLACKTLTRLNVCDFIYNIRERNDGDWDAPDVKAWSDACTTLEKYSQTKEAK